MIQTQNFDIHPNGIIKGGSATYTVNTVAGSIAYSGKIIMPRFIADKSIGGTYHVDPSKFLSANLLNMGDTLTIDMATFKVVETNPPARTVCVYMTVPGQPVSGYAELDVSGDYFKIDHITATVKAGFFGTVVVDASPILSFSKFNVWQKIYHTLKGFFIPWLPK